MDEMEKIERELSKRDYFVISSMLFALFFGAGNLIFPLHLGQIAGHDWSFAAVGFLVTGVLLPLFSVLAIALTHSDGVYDIGLPAGAKFALVFMTLIHLTIGPLFGTPRTATVSYTIGIAPFVPKQFNQIGLLIFTTLFFIFAYLIAYKESDILSALGKILNPIFLILLFLVFFIAFLFPMGDPNAAPATKAYGSSGLSFINGFLEGYNTMDALAGLAFGVTIITAIRQMGKKEDKSVAIVTAKSGVFSMSAIGLIYVFLIIIGAMSLGRFKVSADGGIAFSQIVQSYAGIAGQALLAALIILTCITTAVGLVAAFAQDFHAHYSKLSYHNWLGISCGAAFLVANCGLETIIAWSKPVLMLLYPIAIVVIILSLGVHIFKKNKTMYVVSLFFTLIPAILDMIVSMPPVVSQSSFGLAIAHVRNTLPLAGQGLSWVVPMLVGLILGTIIFKIKAKNS